MKQYEAVEKISENIIASRLCDAIFLKGSLARGSEDQYSNIDLYVIVKEQNIDQFLDKQLELLSEYNSILYSNTIRKGQLVCIFANGIRLDMMTITLNDLSEVDDMAIVYDPHKLLNDYEKIPLSYQPHEFGEIINSFCLTSLEFYTAYNRQDFIYCLKLASDLSVDLGIFLRIHFDPEYAKLGLKFFIGNIDNETKQKYMAAIKKLKYDTILESVKIMFVLLDNYVNNLPIRLAEYLNFDFYSYTKRLIMSIVE